MSSLNLVKDPSPQTYISIGLILTGGTMFTTWLGDMITDRGIGNGHNDVPIIFRVILCK